MKLFILLVGGCLLCSCGEQASDQSAIEDNKNAASLFDTQMEALDSAKSVEQSLDEAVEARDKAMRDQGI